MANQWLRLWHDMPTDPKWRTIARASGQRIGDVMAVYLHLMVCGSMNDTERGRTQSFNAEDVASALDLETEQVASIAAAMQGRVLDGDTLTGWEKRQVQREDGSAERAKAWREAQKRDGGNPNAGERNRTLDKDTEKDKEEKKKGKRVASRTPLPVDFYPNESGLAAVGHLSLATELESFRNHHAAEGTLMADWQAAFRKWIGNAHKWAKKPRTGSGPAEPAWRTEQRQRTQQAAPGVAVQDAAQFFDMEATDGTTRLLG
jgi:hypothetical protein